MFRGYSLNRMLVLFVTAGFAFLLLDTFLEHRDVLTSEIWSLVPVIFSALAMIVGIIAVARWKNGMIRFLNGVLIASLVVGLAGMYFHLREEDDKDERGRPAVEQRTDRDEGLSTGEGEEAEKDKPPLAPLAFGGLAVLGLMATSRRWQSEPRG